MPSTRNSQSDNSLSDYHDIVDPKPLNGLTRLVMWGIVLLVGVGLLDAIANLPIITGCNFYGQCTLSPMTDEPSELGLSPVK